jgi:TRAP-type C4-dicarboxylate transport system permease small subunit
MRSTRRLLAFLSSATLAVAGAAIIGMALTEAWQVFARYVLDDPPSWTEPVALVLMSTAMMFGAAAGVRMNRHFGFFILVEASPPLMQRVLRTLARAIAAAIGLMLLVQGGAMMLDAWSYPMAGVSLPQGLVFLPVCAGGALIALFALEGIFLPPESTPEAR